MAHAIMTFPPDFLWGTATSAYQVEGNNSNSDWFAWEAADPARIKGDLGCGPASDWWQNAEADLDIAAALGTNAHRLSLEWSRIEPEPSVFDSAAIARYRAILQACHDRGLEPMVTLHHFSNPLWLVEKGDFHSEIVVEYFRRYTAKVVAELGDLIPKWITINEPVTYGVLRYLTHDFPNPGRGGFGALFAAIHNMLRCHAAAYHTIKEAYPAALVGTANNMQVFAARPDGNAIDRRWARMIDRLYNDSWPDALHTGRYRGLWSSKRFKGLAGTYDFVGINYYTRFYLRFPPPPGFVDREWGPEALVSDGAYGEVYAHGLYEIMERVWRRYQKPIYITENGLPDAADRLRPGFLLDHLRQIWHAISFCYPIMGYYHWSLVDNFEWDRGWTQRFGLVAVDPTTQARAWRPSAHLYQEICRSYSISDDMAARYAPEMLAVMWPGEEQRAEAQGSGGAGEQG
ncbi:glycoside hydrolase family 1 protein [Candidatus Promineifilum breve]|nr:glycoside hydrolase family 1 protein [Candidatus Promineifilum breve]